MNDTERAVDVLIVGAGIAGLSAACFAARAGRWVTIVDDGAHRASDLPIALVNPLRGHTGRVIADGVAGMRATFALIGTLREAGHAIAAGRGLYRPLIDVPEEAAAEPYWRTRIDGRLAFDWHATAPSSLGLATPVPALYLHDAGWVAPRGLLDALKAASAAHCIVGRVTRVVADRTGGGTVSLADGSIVEARALLWCGGAWGAALLDDDASPHDALYKPGSLLAVDARLTDAALSFGLYAAPWTASIDGGDRAVTLIGPTREDTQARFPDTAVPPEAVVHLGDRIARVFGSTLQAEAVWRGVRLARLSSAASAALGGVSTLTALGSRGFLMAPLLAEAWARSL